ncbi:MAG: PAS domain S-box protein, partial [Phycisphaerales bacterium]|nr:PAS domain S-box protein [Phycisphaerales bacterium]
EVLGQSFLDHPFIFEADYDVVRRQMDQLLRGQLPRFSAVYRTYRRDGSVIWCEWHHSAMTDPEGLVVSVLSQAVDITDRVRAEVELRHSRQVIESHLDNSPLAIVEWGPDFRFLRWSRGAERIFGYSAGEMIGRAFDKLDHPLIHPDDLAGVMQHVERLVSGKSVRDSITARNFRKDGSVVWMNWHSSSLYDAGGRLVSVLSSGIDVTDRVNAEQALRESEKEFRAAFQLALVGMTQVDPITRRYLSVNEQFCRITGYTEAELRQMDPLQITHPEDRARLEARAAEVLSGKTDHYIDQRRCIRKDGKVIWLHVAATLLRDEKGQPVRVVSAALDITDRVEVEQQLRESQRILKLLVSNLPGMAYRCRNDRDWTMIFASERAIDLTGHSAEDLTSGRVTWSSLLHPDEADALWNTVQQAVAERRPFQLEYRLRHRDGSWRWMWEQGQGVYDEAGNLLALEGFITDVTERKRAEQQLAAERDRAEAASRAKDRFIATLSHELRSPLTPARALLSVLRDDPRLPADVRCDLQTVHRNVQIESRLIDDLLDVTRLARGDVEIEWQICDVHPLITAAVNSARSTPQARGINFRIEPNATARHARIDPHRLTQVLWNLLENATKFTPAGGTVSVRTFNPPPADGPARICIEVQDTGVGIAPEHMPHIFEPFERGESRHRYQYTGLGLGLAIARSLTEKMGGTISAESQGPGCGATFTITLPTAAAPWGIPAEQPADSQQPDFSSALVVPDGLRVLLVEDHTTTGEILGRLLGRIGCRTTVASSSAEALRAAAEEEFDLILSDIGLPDGSGHELLRVLRQRGLKAPAIALSGYGMSSDLESSRAAGFVRHLTKPIDFQTLRAAIAEATHGQRD